LFGTALGVLLAALAFSFSPAAAIYIGDGSKQNGTTDGSGNTTNWDITDYGSCVTGIKSDGTMVIDATKTSRPDCLTVSFPALTTSAACVGDTDANGGSHYWASTCVANDGALISLKGLDRTNTMCNQAAVKAGKTSGALALKCTGAWVYRGPANDGAPGFCYTKVDLTSFYGTVAADCPTSTAGFKFATSQCSSDYGIAGYAFAAIAKKDGTGNYVAAGAAVDLSALNQGQCLAAGASWSTGVTKSGTTAVATTPAASTIAVVETSRAGCLECHNNTSQNNGYAERWKSSYLDTGHKNMLRKVTPGKAWAGADGHAYTTDGTNAINFSDASITVGGVKQNLYYVYGDWMAPLPSVVYGTTGFGSAPGATNGYSCAACHSTGFANVAGAAGVCAPDSTKTTSATCLAPNTWYPTTGVQGADGAEPQASFPGITGVTGTWDKDGIICSRCHQTVFAKTGTNANGATFAGPAGTSTHNVTAASNASEANNNVCFGCHQSPATTYVAQTINGIAYPANAKILDPTMIPTGAGHGANWGREFNGHVLGNMFLNSPHARYTGTLVPNKVGKYDLAVNTPANYDSHFKGSLCRSSTTVAGGSILSTVIKGGAVAVIESLADCNLANGFGTEAAPDTTARGYWQSESVGNCTTCHDVHQSLFDATATEPIRRECGVTCHGDKADWSTIKHPMGTGTPIGDGSDPTAPCEICHMPKPTAEGFPMHLWRINTDSAYDTFPTLASFYGGSCSINPTVNTTSALCTAPAVGGVWTAATKDRRAKTAPDGTYTQAVWVDLDLACGQCHGGSAGATATKNNAPYFDKSYLSFLASGMHSQLQSLPPTVGHSTPVINTLTVSFNDTSADNNHQAQSTLAVSVNWGDGKVTTGVGGGAFSHTYASPGTYTIVHTVRDSGARIASELISVKVASTTAVKYTLMVRVRQSDGTTGIPGATVYLKKLSASGYVQVNYNYTNASGNFTFNNLIAGETYKVVVYSSTTDFNGAVAYKQGQVSLDPILMDKARIVQFVQGTPATNGPVGRLWAGTNGTAPTISDVTP
jgi:hypothetical protein